MTDQIILTDIDGVVLDWENGFHEFMQGRGYELIKDFQNHYNMSERFGGLRDVGNLINQYNNSASIGFLEPFRDAAEILPVLHAMGYRFIALTSLSNDRHACMSRERNLREVIGPVFDEVICLDTGAPKHQELQELRERFADAELYWVEDLPANYQAGVQAGITSFLMNHKHNHLTNQDERRVNNWAEIAEHILGEPV